MANQEEEIIVWNRVVREGLLAVDTASIMPQLTAEQAAEPSANNALSLPIDNDVLREAGNHPFANVSYRVNDYIIPQTPSGAEAPDVDLSEILNARCGSVWSRCKNYRRFGRYGRFIEEQIREGNLTAESAKKYREVYDNGQKMMTEFVKSGTRPEGVTTEFASLFESSDAESIDALLLNIVRSIQSILEFKHPVINFIHHDFEQFHGAVESIKHYFRPRLAELIKKVPQEKMLALATKFIGCYRKIYDENNAAHLSDPGLIMRRIVDDIGTDDGWAPMHTYADIRELYSDLAAIAGCL